MVDGIMLPWQLVIITETYFVRFLEQLDKLGSDFLVAIGMQNQHHPCLHYYCPCFWVCTF